MSASGDLAAISATVYLSQSCHARSRGWKGCVRTWAHLTVRRLASCTAFHPDDSCRLEVVPLLDSTCAHSLDIMLSALEAHRGLASRGPSDFSSYSPYLIWTSGSPGLGMRHGPWSRRCGVIYETWASLVDNRCPIMAIRRYFPADTSID